MKYEGFEVTKDIEKRAKEVEKEFTATEIMYYQNKLEIHTRSIGHFLTAISYDWNLNPCYVALYNILKSTMVQNSNGYWISK